MTGNQYVTTELVDAVARAPFDSGRAGCPWDAVAPIHQYGLRARALAFLGDAIPVMLAQGWRPPAVTITDREQLAALPVGSAVMSGGTVWQSWKDYTSPLTAADVLDGRAGEYEVIWGSSAFGTPHRHIDVMAKMGLPAELLLVGTDELLAPARAEDWLADKLAATRAAARAELLDELIQDARTQWETAEVKFDNDVHAVAHVVENMRPVWRVRADWLEKWKADHE